MNELFLKAMADAEIAGQRFYLNVSSRFSGLQGGSRFGRNTGHSLEFVDHREYQPGDDIRHIDWNAMARSDRLTVKLFREEVSPHLDILIDASASMNLENTRKYEALMGMVTVLRVAAVNSGYTVTCWLVKDQCRRVEPANLPVSRWRGAECDFSGNVGRTFVSFPPQLRPDAVRVLISDLFWNEEPMSVVRQLADNAALLVIVQVLAQADIAPQLTGNIRLVDSESAETVEMVADEALLDDYQQNFARHQQYWKKCCTRAGAVFCHCHAENFVTDFVPVDLLKSEILLTRSR